MIVIFPLLVSKNVQSHLVQGVAVTLEQYIASYVISDFVGKDKAFNKFYQYKVKGGKIYQESDVSWFDLDPLTKNILNEQESLNEVIYDPYGKPIPNIPKPKPKPPKPPTAAEREREEELEIKRKGTSAARKYLTSKARERCRNAKDKADCIKQVYKQLGKGIPKTAFQTGDPLDTDDITKGIKTIDQIFKDLKKNRDTTAKEKKELEKPGFKSASISPAQINLEPTWVKVMTKDGAERRLGIKVIPMMIEGFNIKHTISLDMQKYFLTAFLSGIGRKVMRLVYRLIDRWTMFGQRPRGDIRHDLFYARTGHKGQPFILLDKNEDIPPFFFAQPQNMLKMWKLAWGNLLIADDSIKTVMFCMKKYKGMCSNFTYSMIYAQTKEMGKVFEDMEDARRATGALFRMKKKISSLGGK